MCFDSTEQTPAAAFTCLPGGASGKEKLITQKRCRTLLSVTQIKCLTGFCQEPVLYLSARIHRLLVPSRNFLFTTQHTRPENKGLSLFPVNMNHMIRKKSSWAFLSEAPAGSKKPCNSFKVIWLQRKKYLLKLINKSTIKWVCLNKKKKRNKTTGGKFRNWIL